MKSLAEKGREFYNQNLKSVFEPERNGNFIALDPETGEYFLGATGREALGKAETALPARRFYLQRIGFTFAHMSVSVRSFNNKFKRKPYCADKTDDLKKKG